MRKVFKTAFDTAYYGVLNYLPIKARLRIQYFKSFRLFPDFDNPKTFNEKCQWLKLQNDPRIPRATSKVTAKEMAAERIGWDHITPTLYAGDFLPPIEQRNWPAPYVIKASHGSGLNIFIRSEADKDWAKIEAKLREWLAFDFGYLTGELYYGKMKPQVLVEPFIGENGEQPLDYKVFVFDGVPRFIQLDTDRATAHKRNMYDTDWNLLPFRYGWPNDTRPFRKPEQLDELLSCAARLARGFPFMRADFYVVGGKVIFGEMGFTPDAGLNKFYPSEIDLAFGELWPISNDGKNAVRRVEVDGKGVTVR